MQPYAPHFLCSQAKRTEPTRRHIYNQIIWGPAPISLDLGCGTGVIASELVTQVAHSHVIGLDINPALLKTAQKQSRKHPSLHFLLADANAIPLRTSCINFAISHFTMMWLPNRKLSMSEIHRILQSKGYFAALEPDYAGRIEASQNIGKPSRPASFPIIEYLIRTGADPYTGSQLPSELEKCDLQLIHVGILAWEYDNKSARAETQEEKSLLYSYGIQWTPPKFTYTPIFWILARKC
ncbi:MAG: class I SAM-dependent methyltransferase [Promethearchaeota archaeon]